MLLGTCPWNMRFVQQDAVGKKNEMWAEPVEIKTCYNPLVRGELAGSNLHCQNSNCRMPNAKVSSDF